MSNHWHVKLGKSKRDRLTAELDANNIKYHIGKDGLLYGSRKDSKAVLDIAVEIGILKGKLNAR